MRLMVCTGKVLRWWILEIPAKLNTTVLVVLGIDWGSLIMIVKVCFVSREFTHK
jgi:hypothetical protein